MVTSPVPWDTEAAPSYGAVWESVEFTLTDQDAGSLLPGPFTLIDDTGTITLNCALRNAAKLTDIRTNLNIGMTLEGVNGNFDTDPPGFDFVWTDAFSDLDLGTDDVAVTIDADVAGLAANSGVFACIFPNGVNFNDNHVSVGEYNTGATFQRFARRRLGGATVEPDAAITGSARSWLTLHWGNGMCRACVSSAVPPNPYSVAALSGTVQPPSVWSGTTVDSYVSASLYTAASLRGSVVGMRGAGTPDVVIRKLILWRLKRDSATG
jgi:hypothetical protein